MALTPSYNYNNISTKVAIDELTIITNNKTN